MQGNLSSAQAYFTSVLIEAGADIPAGQYIPPEAFYDGKIHRINSIVHKNDPIGFIINNSDTRPNLHWRYFNGESGTVTIPADIWHGKGNISEFTEKPENTSGTSENAVNSPVLDNSSFWLTSGTNKRSSEFFSRVFENMTSGGKSFYFQRKNGVQPCDIRFSVKDGIRLVNIPLRNIDGEITGIQQINDNTGEKRLFSGSVMKGSFYRIEGMPDIENRGYPIFICEGVATGISIMDIARGQCEVVCAISAVNIKNVSIILKEHFPQSKIIIACDNDKENETETGINAGIEAGKKAAEAIDAPFIFPPDIDGKNTDFNDFYISVGYSKAHEFYTKQTAIKKAACDKAAFSENPLTSTKKDNAKCEKDITPFIELVNYLSKKM